MKLRVLSAAVLSAAIALCVRPVGAGVVYDSTNFTTSGAPGYGAGATSSTDLNGIWGDLIFPTGTGILDTFKFAVFCSGSSAANLTSATETIRFYRGSDSTLIGSFSVSLGALTKGFYSVNTVTNLSSSGIVLPYDASGILVTQQLSNVVGATRMGTVFGNASNTPAVGSTAPGMYISNTTTAGGFYVFTGYTSYSSSAYQLSLLQNLAWNTTNGTWNTAATNWRDAGVPGTPSPTKFTNGDSATFSESAGGTVTLSGLLSPSAVNVSAASGTYTFVSSAGNELTGTTGLTKSGAGTLILAGPNSYSGNTTVSAGVLQVDGSLANSSVTVANGATLGGHGTIGSLVTVLAGGTLSPGNSVGALTVGSLDLQVGSSVLMQIVGSGSSAGTAGTDYDQLTITSPAGLGYGGELNLAFSNLVDFDPGTTFQLFSFTGSPSRHFGSVVSTGTGAYAGLNFTQAGDVWTSSAGNRTLTFDETTGQLVFSSAAVPEPTSATLLALAGLGLIIARRRSGQR